jgi:tetratricopeptide (TPR) repeat protein
MSAGGPLREPPENGPETEDVPASIARRVVATSNPAQTPSPARLEAGDVLADRFAIERLAGRGGMGAVYRALDRVTGLPVALKVMSHGGHVDRFAREARVLAEVTHPAVVGYVADGTTAQGDPWLAMEWLDGEDVGRRLVGQPLTVAESLTIARRIADGLAVAHTRGLVHRDVKPSNVFLVGGDPAQAKLLDFGIVRQLSTPMATAAPMTGTGTVLGTVGYMSPEQAIADPDLDARADVFALGCLLFECLTGRPVFCGVHVVAVLAKVLREEAPRIRSLRPELPPALDELLARMLCKERSGRPADGDALLREIDALGTVMGGVPGGGAPMARGLSGGEQRLVGVMLGLVPHEADAVSAIVRRHDGEPARLANGALLVTLSRARNADAQIVAAAACALETWRAFPSSRIALATGRAQTTGDAPPGPVIDQAAALLARSAAPGVWLDEVTAGLLGDRFALREERGTGLALVDRRRRSEAPRTLLGKPTPCVGRDKELGLLEATLRECVDESVARAVIVSGAAGRGKSRLRHELVNRAAERGDVTILTARADPVGAGSAFVMARQLVRDAGGLRDGDVAAEQHAQLRAHLDGLRGPACDEGHVARIADFLGELLGVPPVDPGPELRAARGDPRVMGDWMRRSFGEWLAAMVAAQPLLVVLEDLHWGDAPSIAYVSDALRDLGARPLMVLGLGRPELHQVFPSLWSNAEVQEIALGRLVPRAAERLVRAVLAEPIANEAVAEIVERADGNAFYLEELTRCVAEGGAEKLPQTVIALAQSRLERLEPDARRVVRAASLFGEVFWSGAVASLLGGTHSVRDVEAWLAILCRDEVITRVPSSRYPGESEYAFRHGLLREAAYAMLTEADRVTGHRLAGDWLEASGERHAAVVARHFERGGVPARAAAWYREAATQAVEGNDLARAQSCCERGMACGATGALLAELSWTMAESLQWRGEFTRAAQPALDAMRLVDEGTPLWLRAAGTLATAYVAQGRANDLDDLARRVLAVCRAAPLTGDEGAIGVAHIAFQVLDPRLGTELLALVDALCERSAPGPLLFGWLNLARSNVQLYLGRSEDQARYASMAADAFRGAGDQRVLASALVTLSCAYIDLGAFPQADEALEEAWAIGDRFGLGDRAAMLGNRGLACFMQGKLEEAESLSRAAMAVYEKDGDQQSVALVRFYLARIFVAQGRHAEAEAASRAAAGTADGIPAYRAAILATVAEVLLATGRAAEALEPSTAALESLHSVGTQLEEGFVRRVHADALRANGRHEEARTLVASARDALVARAAGVSDPALREAFLRRVPDHAKILGMAEAWGC